MKTAMGSEGARRRRGGMKVCGDWSANLLPCLIYSPRPHLTTSNSTPSGVRMSLNMMTPSGLNAPRLKRELDRDVGGLGIANQPCWSTRGTQPSVAQPDASATRGDARPAHRGRRAEEADPRRRRPAQRQPSWPRCDVRDGRRCRCRKGRSLASSEQPFLRVWSV